VHTEDINTFNTDERFDRVVSIEMFEHLRNYQELFLRISRWLNPGGKLFAHIFSHKNYAYLFETEGAKNWMGTYFFTGGMMPSNDLFLYFQRDLMYDKQWQQSGEHYQKTAKKWFQRWRIFYIACAELFGYRKGREWGISHYLFSKRA